MLDEKSPSGDAQNELAYTPKTRISDTGENVKKYEIGIPNHRYKAEYHSRYTWGFFT